jgi:lipopolysaccharide/colanic/teichoic acid biosynthesis glycosyltransferase
MVKRLFDVTCAGLGLGLLSPVLLVIALLIKLDSSGPVFFRQVRVGLREKPFEILKFRTMRVDAEKLGGQLTARGDSRVTRVGRFLRAGKLDELPQLFNVLRGDMSLVGPRPEVPRYVALYTPRQREVFRVRPGITDLASLKFRNESELLAAAADPESFYIHEVMPAKLELNLRYIAAQSLGFDLGIILQTLWRVLFPEKLEMPQSLEKSSS